MVNTQKTLGLYVHIPFCLSKCAYCDFCSVAGAKSSFVKKYLNALKKDLRMQGALAEDCLVNSIFIGGGTPTALKKSLMKSLISEIYSCFNISSDVEFTVEANPATVNLGYAKMLNSLGVNRVSMGLQSANADELFALGRIHSLDDFKKSFEILRRAGIDNINVDIMFGIPKQTPESFLNTLKTVCSMRPEHISAYGLQIEEGTPFYDMRDTLPLPDEDEEYSMYVYASEFLREQGYQHYEISNFALRGKRCRHNLKYWNCKEYIGVGCAAHSFFCGERIGRTEDIGQYINAMLAKRPEKAIDSIEKITLEDMESEYVMLRMRLSDGVNKREYTSLFGFDFDKKYGDKIKKYVDTGFVVNTHDRCAFTTDGMYISNTVLSSILEL